MNNSIYFKNGAYLNIHETGEADPIGFILDVFDSAGDLYSTDTWFYADLTVEEESE